MILHFNRTQCRTLSPSRGDAETLPASALMAPEFPPLLPLLDQQMMTKTDPSSHVHSHRSEDLHCIWRTGGEGGPSTAVQCPRNHHATLQGSEGGKGGAELSCREVCTERVSVGRQGFAVPSLPFIPSLARSLRRAVHISAYIRSCILVIRSASTPVYGLYVPKCFPISPFTHD